MGDEQQLRAALQHFIDAGYEITSEPVVVTPNAIAFTSGPGETHPDAPEFSRDATAAEIRRMIRENVAHARRHGDTARATRETMKLRRFCSPQGRIRTGSLRTRPRGAGRPKGRATRSSARSGDSPSGPSGSDDPEPPPDAPASGGAA